MASIMFHVIVSLLFAVLFLPFSITEKANEGSDKNVDVNDFAEFETEEDEDEVFEPETQVEEEDDGDDDDDDDDINVEAGTVINTLAVEVIDLFKLRFCLFK